MLSSQTLCYLTRSGTKLCLSSSSQSCFNLQSIPHILCVLSSPWKAPPSHPVNNQLAQGLIFPVSALPAWPRFLSPWPPAWQAATAVCGALVLSLVVPSSLFALWEAQKMSVGTVLFQSSSYGKEGRLLCCLSEGTSEPAVSFTGRMLGVGACPVPFLCFSKCFKGDEVLSSWSRSMRPATGRCDCQLLLGF